MQNHIVLVDEYDQIYDDILPFLALKPSEFRDRARSLRTDTSLPWHAHSFSLEVKDGTVVFPPGGAPGGGKKEDMLELLADFTEMLPDLDIRINGGDEPSVVISGETRQKHEKAAREGEGAFRFPSCSGRHLQHRGGTDVGTSCAHSPQHPVVLRALRTDRFHAVGFALPAQLNRPPPRPVSARRCARQAKLATQLHLD